MLASKTSAGAGSTALITAKDAGLRSGASECSRAAVRSEAHSSALTIAIAPLGKSWLPCPPRKASIALPHYNDERELESGCVDWFLYEDQQAQCTRGAFRR